MTITSPQPAAAIQLTERINNDNVKLVQIGKYQGATVRVSQSPQSMLHQAIEELSFKAGEHKKREGVERPTTSAARNPFAALQHATEELSFGASERRNKTVQESKDPALEQATEQDLDPEYYFEKLPDLDRSQLSQLVRQLEQDSNASKSKLQSYLADLNSDISYQQATLSFILQTLSVDNPWRDAAAQMFMENGRSRDAEILAGLNVTQTAIAHAKAGVAPQQELTDFFRRESTSSQSIAETAANIIVEHGGEQLKPRLEFLKDAAGEDLRATRSSVDETRLHSILEGLGQLKTLDTLREHIGKVLERFEARYLSSTTGVLSVG